MSRLLRYSKDEYMQVLAHIEKTFGDIVQIYSGTLADPVANTIEPFIELDLCVIAPTPERNYYTFVTIGLGSNIMPVPEELIAKNVARAELCFALPADTVVEDENIDSLWPVRLMNMIACYTIREKLWIGWGHTFFDGSKPFGENTKLSSVLLVSPGADMEQVCTLTSREEVNFYCILPLYNEELEFTNRCGADHLLEKFIENKDVLKNFKAVPIIDENRPNVGLDIDVDKSKTLIEDTYYIGDVVDCAKWHEENIIENKLEVDYLQSLNHIAAFLRFALTKELLEEDFIKLNKKMVIAVLLSDSEFDLRQFLNDNYKGCLLYDFFNDEGFSFVNYYYNKIGDEPSRELHSYLADLDKYAQATFEENWQEDEAKRPYAYLYLEYNENYYKAMHRMIEKHYKEWKEMFESKKPLYVN